MDIPSADVDERVRPVRRVRVTLGVSTSRGTTRFRSTSIREANSSTNPNPWTSSRFSSCHARSGPISSPRRRLRSAGDGERADEVKKLRKPTVGVWLVNQLARERELDVQRLLKAGESLTQSQAKGGAGESSQKFRLALERLARAAREIAEREGIGASALDKATETLRAASLSAEERELLKRGRLTEELEPPGFEALIGQQGVARGETATERKPPRDERAEKRGLAKEARERVSRLRGEERELATTARAAEREAERAEGEAAAARSRANDAQDEVRALTHQREAAEAELDRRT